MNAPTFDPKLFKSMTFTGSNSTESIPIPVGDHLFTITKVDITSWQSRDGASSGLKLLCTFETEDAEIAQITGRAKSQVRYEAMLDLLPGGQGLDMGKGMNVKLGRLREATGLNDASRPFAFDMLLGHTVLATIGHRITDTGTQVAEAKAVAAP